MEMTTAILGDFNLLKKLREDLVAASFIDRVEYNDNMANDIIYPPTEIVIELDDRQFYCISYQYKTTIVMPCDHLHELTHSNYTTTLETIINRYKK